MSGRDSLREGFFQECEDLLEIMSDGFAQIQEGTHDSETVNAVFRAVHSIKGGAGAFGLNGLVAFSHGFENLLDDIRAGKVAADGSVQQLLFRAGDKLYDLVEAARNGDDGSADCSDLLEELAAACAGGGMAASSGCAEPAAEDEDVDFTPQTLSLELPGLPDLDGPDQADEGVVRFRFTPLKQLYAVGNDPLPLFRALQDLGAVSVTPNLDRLPLFKDLEWEEAYLSWDLSVETDRGRDAVEEVFEFVAGDSKLEFLATDEAPSGHPAISEIESNETLDDQQMSDPPDFPAAMEGGADSQPAAMPEMDTAPPPTMSEQPQGAKSQRSAKQSIRVDLDRVDRLINLVGELVISEAMLTQSLSESGTDPTPAVAAALGQLKQLSTELQERIMAIRAQSVKPLFQRMSRIVRETASAANKDVRLITEGEATEVDKTVIERLADPLTHMLRNSIDHGIESREIRAENGKNPEGQIKLTAAHKSGQVIIKIEDDGKGIDCDAVLRKAIERRLVQSDNDLGENEIFNLLFEPGFSTAEKISKLSGRGVGMDVVRSEIQSLGGRVNISSTKGVGTAVTISLPLTLAVVEGMLVDVAGETLVVPSTTLRETILAEATMVHRMGRGDPVITVREEIIPLVDLGASLGYRKSPEIAPGKPILIVESSSGRSIALSVDRITDQREVVIKGLSENYGEVLGVAAATILGDGRIALIIDVDQVSTSTQTNSQSEERGELEVFQ